MQNISFFRALTKSVVACAVFGLVLFTSGCDSAAPMGDGDTWADAHLEFDGNADDDGRVDLIAGQHHLIGFVSVEIQGDNLLLTYNTEGTGWCIQLYHAHVALSKAGLPATRQGNPIPGHFQYSEPVSPCGTVVPVTMALPAGYEPGDTLYIAAHAEAREMVGTGNGPGYLFGIRRSGADQDGFGGDIYKVYLNGGVTVSHFFDTNVNAPATNNWPNGLAFDPEAGDDGRLYFTNTENSLGSGLNPLYFVDIATMTQVSAGNLFWRNAAGVMVNGDYYYVGQNQADNLRRVTFNPDGTMASDAVHCAGFSNQSPSAMFFGDLAYNPATGLIYGSAEFQTDPSPARLFSIDPDTCSYDEIAVTDDALLQLAYDCDGRLIGHDTTDGIYYVVNTTTGALTSLGQSTPDVRMNDLAIGMCPTMELGGKETAWGWGTRFVPQGNWGRYFTFTP